MRGAKFLQQCSQTLSSEKRLTGGHTCFLTHIFFLSLLGSKSKYHQDFSQHCCSKTFLFFLLFKISHTLLPLSAPSLLLLTLTTTVLQSFFVFNYSPASLVILGVPETAANKLRKKKTKNKKKHAILARDDPPNLSQLGQIQGNRGNRNALERGHFFFFFFPLYRFFFPSFFFKTLHGRG